MREIFAPCAEMAQWELRSDEVIMYEFPNTVEYRSCHFYDPLLQSSTPMFTVVSPEDFTNVTDDRCKHGRLQDRRRNRKFKQSLRYKEEDDASSDRMEGNS